MYIPSKPASLKPGSKIRIVAPSGLVSDSYIKKAVQLFESWELQVELGENLFASYNQFAGTDAQRLSDLQSALDDESVAAIICARGGYGLMRIIDKLNWKRFANSPKWITGFSDITVLHSCLSQLAIQSLHSPMPINFENLDESLKPLTHYKEALFGHTLEFTIPFSEFSIAGKAEGILTGGNLSLLYALMGTPYDIETRGKILFLEDVGEQLYHLDRMLQAMRLAGKFEGLKGLIVGGMTEMEDKKRPFGKSPAEIISEALPSNAYPVVFNFPAGHMKANLPLILGGKTTLVADQNRVKITIR